jgi:hypothetical protein
MVELLIRIIVAAVIAVIVDVVLNALVVFPHSALIFGLIAVLIFLAIVFSRWTPSMRGRP